ncbi:Hypothetical_protein [Hexamita inflata]|uniref:Hypothetical_protein n=1 Tax=Hexamita inflata TaxID=28002 RepID=A0AA86V1H2_9EUKA|nr:Hypothetical protein HINF_LOCUS34027 [Hexamita inflata]CAI9976884.1 Hypothetical protein HINF_LOCUS64529 [Hexamita inflata]
MKPQINTLNALIQKQQWDQLLEQYNKEFSINQELLFPQIMYIAPRQYLKQIFELEQIYLQSNPKLLLQMQERDYVHFCKRLHLLYNYPLVFKLIVATSPDYFKGVAKILNTFQDINMIYSYFQVDAQMLLALRNANIQINAYNFEKQDVFGRSLQNYQQLALYYDQYWK